MIFRLITRWLWIIQGLTCREASQLASKALDVQLTVHERVRLGLHHLLCIWCRRYARQLRQIRRWLRSKSAGPDGMESLPPAAAVRIKNVLAAATQRE